MKDIMLDIETLGDNSNSVIVSISAVEFDLIEGKIGKTFEVGLDLTSQVNNGGIASIQTCLWWFNQSKEAVNSLLSIKRLPVKVALNKLTEFIESVEHPNRDDIRLWGNGCTFDNVIVRNLYTREGIEFPLPYWCDSDVRTLVSLANIDTRQYKFEGTKHNGIDDCKHQIKYCIDAYSKL